MNKEPLPSYHVIFNLKIWRFGLIAILQLFISSCTSDDSQQATVDAVQEESTPEVISYPYVEDFVVDFDIAERWHLLNNWFLEFDSEDVAWLEFSKDGVGLGSSVKSYAEIMSFIYIPAESEAPYLTIEHSILLAKKKQYLVVEVDSYEKAVNQYSNNWEAVAVFDSDFPLGRRFSSVELGSYKGKYIRLRFRAIERDLHAEKSIELKTVSINSYLPDVDTNKSINTGSVNKRVNKEGRSESVNKKADEKWNIYTLSVNELDSDRDGIGDQFELRVNSDPFDANDSPVDINSNFIPDLIETYKAEWMSDCFESLNGHYVRLTHEIDEYGYVIKHENYKYKTCEEVWLKTKKYGDYVISHNEIKNNIKFMFEEYVVSSSVDEVNQLIESECVGFTNIDADKYSVLGVNCNVGISYPLKESNLYYESLISSNKLTMNRLEGNGFLRKNFILYRVEE